jgi:putative nucleotidyltransferase with HDIG domain
VIEKQNLIALIRQLPTIPQAVLELQKLLSQPNVSIADVDRVIRTDPALTGNILRLANSAAFGLSRKVADIPQAVTLMGFKVLGNLAHTAAFSKAIPPEFPGYRLTAAQFLRHSFVVGVLSESLASALGVAANRPFFTAGLLHDIGKLVLGTFVATHDQDLSRLLDSQELTFVQVEREILGVDHGQVAAWVGEQWQLPAELISAAELHHRPDEAAAEFQPIVDIVHVADMTAHCLGFGADLGELARSIHKESFERLKLTAELLERVASASLERLMQELPTEGRDSVKLRCKDLLQILVVDDSSIIRQMVCKSLGLAGLPPHEISEACDGAQALSMLRGASRKFDLVLADIHMPNMSGTQLVGAMSEDEELKRIPVVIISSDGNTANHERLRALGVRALLRKPFRPEQFRAVVHPILNDETVRS